MVLGAGVLICGCGGPRTKPERGSGSPPAAGAPVPASRDARPAYRIDAAQSELRLLVYRAGPMAHFGHNHVISNGAVQGWIDPAEQATSAVFSIQLRPADFVVDDAAARVQEGPDFQDAVSDDARVGTRRNMLSPAVLDAERFPAIVLTSVAVAKDAGNDLRATLTVDLAGHTARIVVPFSLHSTPGRIEASGSVQLRQSMLGLTPFSVLLGALQVEDEFTVKFKLIALAG